LIVGIYVTYFVFDGFDDIYQKRLSLKIFDKKIRLAVQTESTGFFLYSIHVCFPCQDNSTLRLSRTIKNPHPNSDLAFSVVPATFQPFVFPIACNILLKAKTIIQIPTLLIPQLFDNNVLTVMVFLVDFLQRFQ
jgi:hypothetical protein